MRPDIVPAPNYETVVAFGITDVTAATLGIHRRDRVGLGGLLDLDATSGFQDGCMNERSLAIEIRGLAKSFGDNRVLTGVDLAVTAVRVKATVAAAVRVKATVAAAVRVKATVAAAVRVKATVAAAVRVKATVSLMLCHDCSKIPNH
jgi:hypothetical protein